MRHHRPKEVSHGGLLQLSPAEKKRIMLDISGFCHFPRNFSASVLIVRMHHRIKIIRPLCCGVAPIAVGYRPNPRKLLAHFNDPVLRHLPGDHGIGGESRFLMPQRRTETSDKPLFTI